MAADPQFDWWRNARKGIFGPMQEANPQSGYYRHYAGPAIGIWRNDGDGKLNMQIDGVDIPEGVQRGKTWLQVAKSPVAFADYKHRVDTGEWRSDLPPVAAPTIKTEETETAARGPGDNSGDLDTYQRMRAEILGDVAEATAFFAKTKITDKLLADKATDWGARLVKFAREAEKARLAENEPLRRQIEENDNKWKAIRDPALSKGEELRAAADAWGKAEVERIRKEQEEERRKKWEAEQAEIRRQRAEAAAAEAKRRDEEAARAAAAGVTIAPEPEPEPLPELPLAPPPPPVAPAPKLMLGTGANGNRRSVKTSAPETATIVDLEAAAAFFARQKHPEIVTLVQKLADRAIKARAEIPGIQFSWQTKTEAAE